MKVGVQANVLSPYILKPLPVVKRKTPWEPPAQETCATCRVYGRQLCPFHFEEREEDQEYRCMGCGTLRTPGKAQRRMCNRCIELGR